MKSWLVPLMYSAQLNNQEFSFWVIYIMIFFFISFPGFVLSTTLELSTLFWKIIWAPWGKWSEKLKYGIGTLLRYVVLGRIIDQNNILHILISNSKTVWPSKTFNAILVWGAVPS